jgi:uncharacterized membrane protein (DUF2068 family)
VRAIVIYKLGKAIGELALALGLAGAVASGWIVRLHDVVAVLHEHVVRAWSLQLARALMSVTDRHHVRLVIAALLADGTLTLFEGWALLRRFHWAPWIVVLATGSLLPFELVELARRVRLGRLLVLLVNSGIVFYLARRALASRIPNSPP